MWTKQKYGGIDSQERGGRWAISNGHIRFDIHWTNDGTITKARADKDGYIVTPTQADEYAGQILNALNKCEVKL